MKTYEVNFDGIVGNTHNYAGLSHGNIASDNNKGSISRPKEAALQGIRKMSHLASIGLKQGVLPPHQRPFVRGFYELGFRGKDFEILEKAYRADAKLFVEYSSSSFMWTANAGTVSPSADTRDGKLHFTPANLSTMRHRACEAGQTSLSLKRIFNNEEHFVHHETLSFEKEFSDEGAANHNRICETHGKSGFEIFVYGKSFKNSLIKGPEKFPARQTLEASSLIAKNHLLDSAKCFFVQQDPDVIDKGVFHNDVISLANENVFFFHENAFVNKTAFMDQLRKSYEQHASDKDLFLVEVLSSQVSVEDAVKSYLFNSQILSLPNGEMVLLCPSECEENERVRLRIEEAVADDSPIRSALYFDLRESMKNGGGPACLRLRVALNEEEYNAVHQPCLFDNGLEAKLIAWVNKYYRDELRPKDLLDPALLEENYTALDELTQILDLPAHYDFQR